MARARFLTAAIVASGAAMLAGGVATASAASAGGPLLLFNQHGLAAQATFSSTVGSLQNFVFVNADTERLQFGAGTMPTSFSEAVAALTQLDTTTGTYTHFDSCIPVGSRPTAPVLPPGALVVANNLRSATLDATFQCTGPLGISLISVDLVWTASGLGVVGHSTTHFRDPTGLINASFTGRSLFDAQAGGTVSDGAQNFTPNPSDNAVITSFENEQIEIGF